MGECSNKKTHRIPKGMRTYKSLLLQSVIGLAILIPFHIWAKWETTQTPYFYRVWGGIAFCNIIGIKVIVDYCRYFNILVEERIIKRTPKLFWMGMGAMLLIEVVNVLILIFAWR